MIAAFFYLLLGEFYLAAHWPQWAIGRSLAVFGCVLVTAIQMVLIQRKGGLR